MKLYKILIFTLLYSALSANSYEEKLRQFISAQKPLVIGNIVVDAQSNNPCVIDNWDHVARYACRCCIVHTADAIAGSQRDGTKILESCKKNGPCTDALIEELREEEDLQDASDTEFVNILYDRSKVIKEVALSTNGDSSKTGKLTPDALKKFLVEAHANKKLLHPAFAKEKCLEVIDLLKEAGTATTQLFLVKNTCDPKKPEFIVKEMGKKKGEAFDLSLASHAKDIIPYVAPKKEEGFPVIMLPIAYLSYSSHGDHYLAVMHKAQGIEFFKLMKEYIAHPTTENKQRLIKAYEILGKTLANFHKKFMRKIIGTSHTREGTKTLTIPDTENLLGRTIIHGDFHPRNYFLDESCGIMYWIDNEKLGKTTINPQSIHCDIGHVIFYPFMADFLLQKENVNKAQWFDTFYTPFLAAYINTFGGDHYKRAQEMKTVLHTPHTSEWRADYKRLQQYIDPVIDNLIAQYKPKSKSKS